MLAEATPRQPLAVFGERLFRLQCFEKRHGFGFLMGLRHRRRWFNRYHMIWRSAVRGGKRQGCRCIKPQQPGINLPGSQCCLRYPACFCQYPVVPALVRPANFQRCTQQRLQSLLFHSSIPGRGEAAQHPVGNRFRCVDGAQGDKQKKTTQEHPARHYRTSTRWSDSTR